MATHGAAGTISQLPTYHPDSASSSSSQPSGRPRGRPRTRFHPTPGGASHHIPVLTHAQFAAHSPFRPSPLANTAVADPSEGDSGNSDSSTPAQQPASSRITVSLPPRPQAHAASLQYAKSTTNGIQAKPGIVNDLRLTPDSDFGGQRKAELFCEVAFSTPEPRVSDSYPPRSSPTPTVAERFQPPANGNLRSDSNGHLPTVSPSRIPHTNGASHPTNHSQSYPSRSGSTLKGSQQTQPLGNGSLRQTTSGYPGASLRPGNSFTNGLLYSTGPSNDHSSTSYPPSKKARLSQSLTNGYPLSRPNGHLFATKYQQASRDSCRTVTPEPRKISTKPRLLPPDRESAVVEIADREPSCDEDPVFFSGTTDIVDGQIRCLKIPPIHTLPVYACTNTDAHPNGSHYSCLNCQQRGQLHLRTTNATLLYEYLVPLCHDCGFAAVAENRRRSLSTTIEDCTCFTVSRETWKCFDCRESSLMDRKACYEGEMFDGTFGAGDIREVLTNIRGLSSEVLSTFTKGE